MSDLLEDLVHPFETDVEKLVEMLVLQLVRKPSTVALSLLKHFNTSLNDTH